MKRNRLLSLLVLTIVSLTVLQSNSGGYQGVVAHTASTSNGGCNCHGPAVASQSNTLKLEVLDASNNVVSSFLPNTNYTVRVTLKKTNANNAAGVQVTVFDAGTTNQAGVISDGTLIKAQNIGGTFVANHSQKDISAIKVGANVTWEFPWKGPLISASDITFSAIANDCNDDGTVGGDFIVYKDQFITQTPISVTDYSKGIKTIYPNPASDNLTIKLDSEKASTIAIYSMTGQLVKQQNATSSKINMDVSNLPNGNYIVAIAQDGNYARQQFVKF